MRGEGLLIKAFRQSFIPITVQLMLILKQLKLSVEQCHHKNDAEAKNGGQRECIEHLLFLFSDLGLLLLKWSFKKENRHFEIAKPTHRSAGFRLLVQPLQVTVLSQNQRRGRRVQSCAELKARGSRIRMLVGIKSEPFR